MANNATYGFESRTAFAAAGGAFDATCSRFDVVSTSVKKQGEILDSPSLLGSRTRREDRTRAGIVNVGGQIVFNPTIRQLDYFLPYILGAAESTDTFNVADALSGFDLLHDYFTSGTSAIKYGELYVNRAALRFGPGLLTLTLDVVGKTVTTGQTWAGTIPALPSTALLDDPLVFYDSASGFTIQSGVIEIEEGELVVDNALDVKFRNSQTATSIRATDQTVSLVTNIPLTATTLSTYFGDKAAADATIVLTRSTVSATITLFNLKAPDSSPEVGGKGEVPLVLTSAARGDASDPNIRVVVDETV